MRTVLLPPALLLLLLAGCGAKEPAPGEGCKLSSDCAEGQLCSNGACLDPPRPCEPQSCADFGRDCGTVDDGCGSTLSCGSCTAPLSCGGASVAGVCGCPLAAAVCNDAPFACGPHPDGCGGTVECGCPAGTSCGGGGIPDECGPITRPFCWGRLAPVTGLDDPLQADYGATVLADPAGDLLVWITGRWSGTSQTDVAWARLDGARAIDPATVGLFPAQPTGAGWNGQPTIRPDGLELWFYSSKPDANWADNDLYVAHRATLDAPWEGPERLHLLDGHDAHVHVLLPDDRTLVFRDESAPDASFSGLLTARRATTAPGDLSFVLAEGPVLVAPDGLAITSLAVSCDGGSLLMRFTDGGAIQELVELPILSTDPLTLGEPVPYEVPAELPGQLLMRFEAPDCRTLYLSTEARDTVYAAPRAPCP